MFSSAFSGAEHKAFCWNGGASAALMVHGFPGSPAEMRPLAQVLREHGWTVEALLLPGFGAEIDTLASRRCEEWYGAVMAALGDLRRRHDKVMLVGYSLGGALSARAAADSEVAGLALLAPFWKLGSPLWTLLPALKVIFPTVPIFKLISLDFRDPETRKGIARFLPDADLDDPAVQREVREFRLPIAMFNQIRQAGILGYNAMPRVSAPTLVVQGKQDELVHPALTQQLAQRIPGLWRLVEVDGSHDLLHPARPAWPLVCTAILDLAALVESDGV